MGWNINKKLNNDYGNSRWAKLKDIKKMNIGMLSNEGMVFGVFGNKFIRTKETITCQYSFF
jgi:type IV secretory pathway TraG/TraD family ATPase VirD4